MFIVCILLTACQLCSQPVAAQCNGNVAAYPYEEDFENSDGGWTTNGNATDWQWGTPQKKIIKGAGNGAKCWITGGLTKTAYNNNERSYLQTPCFDLTALTYPYIRFKIFCDTEQDWDGANLQYSPDNGRIWIKIGYFGQPEDCFNSGWYNDNQVHFVSNGDGWSGSNTTGGKWITAQIKLPFTGGTNKTVMFRFYFGAGDKNNNYDGFGIDDFFMGELPNAATASFSYTCINASTVEFKADASPCLTNLQWNFNDAASGLANIASGGIVAHQFSAPGNYLISLTASDNNGTTITSTNKITIIAATIHIVQPVLCAGGNANVEAVVQGPATIAYQYNWNTNSETNTAKAALPAGNYTLQISGEHTCPVQTELAISEPQPLSITPDVMQPDCNKSNGSIHLNVTGGTPPYAFNWQSLLSSTANATNLQKGNYNVTVTDKNGCNSQTDVALQSGDLQVNLGNDTTICYGEIITLHAGNFYSYLWDDLSNQPERIIDKAGVYFVQVSNSEGCTASDTINITNDCGDVYFPSAFTPNGDLVNDAFGAAGNINLLKTYSLRIYNRLGNLVFKSSEPMQKWNGRYKNAVAPAGSYLYIATYEYNGVKKTRKGTLVLLL